MEKRKTSLELPPAQEQEIIVSPADVVAMAVAQAKALMDIVEKQKLYELIEKKKYLVVEGWELIGAFNGISACPEYVIPIERQGEIVGYESKVNLTKQGVIAGSGIMSCGLDEFPCRGREGEAKHKACRSAAQTWATSKAYRLKYSFIAKLGGYETTPAEEMGGGGVIIDNRAPQEHWCKLHNVAFEQRKGKWGKFWSHRLPDGTYCNEGKAEKEETSRSSASEAKTSPPVKGEDLPKPEAIKNLGDLRTAWHKFFPKEPWEEALAIIGVESQSQIADAGESWRRILEAPVPKQGEREEAKTKREAE